MMVWATWTPLGPSSRAMLWASARRPCLAEAKAAKFRAVMQELRAKKEQTVAIGDGANDLRMMAEAGLSIAFRAKPVVRAQADCALTYSGLDGVVNLFEP